MIDANRMAQKIKEAHNHNQREYHEFETEASGMNKEIQTHQIVIAVEENNEWHKASIQIKVDGKTSTRKIEAMIAEQATVWASDNGYNYRTWDKPEATSLEVSKTLKRQLCQVIKNQRPSREGWWTIWIDEADSKLYDLFPIYTDVSPEFNVDNVFIVKFNWNISRWMVKV